jgi:hypothetical protein
VSWGKGRISFHFTWLTLFNRELISLKTKKRLSKYFDMFFFNIFIRMLFFFKVLSRKATTTTVKQHNLTMNTTHTDQATNNNDSTH